MRRVAGRALWLGHAGDLRDPRAILAAGIEAVIELADSEPAALLPRDLVRCRFPLSDGGANAGWLLRLAAESVAALLTARVPLLICCSGGMSRSVCIAAGGIALAEARPLMESLAEVTASGPVDVAPSLLAQLQRAIGEDRGLTTS
jgi:protein-tyrosine phosphatase